MITYVDTSTLLKLVVEEAGSDSAALIWDSADALASVGLVVVEARAALAAAHRAGRLTDEQHHAAKREIAALVDELHLVDVTAGLIETASDLAEAEGLRGYDAVHLAGALFVGASILTSADDSLSAAASRQGLHVADPLNAPQE
ncbi:MAG TPA: type II toxin-antitoxin system VapC family toxin [Acidimicrobiales bacterium]|nr:type II toxin-antitoxin system VapC family toxin [Acidimicrobiales bacterium]